MRSLYVKHVIAREWCEIVDTTGGSIATRCRGRMSVGDEYEIHDNPPEHERCGGCTNAMTRRAEVG